MGEELSNYMKYHVPDQLEEAFQFLRHAEIFGITYKVVADSWNPYLTVYWEWKR